jgi:hypothetical protein
MEMGNRVQSLDRISLSPTAGSKGGDEPDNAAFFRIELR